MFKTGVPYKRSQIQEIVGGEIRTYLPQRNGEILAGCFSQKMNPRAPEEIFAGSLPKVIAKAELVSQQPENRFPVFVKPRDSANEYFFHGYYRCTGKTNDPKKIAEAEALSNRHGELSYVLYLSRSEEK